MSPFKVRGVAAAIAGGMLSIVLGSAQAVIIDIANPTPAPAGIDNLGRRGGGTAIYLGNGWVMTANHVGKGNVTFGSTVYTATSAPSIQLHDPYGIAPTDIILFQLTSDPGLPALDIALTSPTAGQTVTMAGFGRDQATQLTYWDSQGALWVVVTDPQMADYTGYTTSSSRSLSWGTNTIQNPTATTSINGLGALSFTTQMDTPGTYGPDINEGQGVEGDSGGAVFITDGPQTLLAGMMVSVDRYPGQPDNTGVYGNITHSMRLWEYRQQIIDIIVFHNVPEPVSLALMGLGAAIMLPHPRKR